MVKGTTISLDEALLEKGKKIARLEEISFSKLIGQLLEQLVEEEADRLEIMNQLSKKRRKP